MQCQIESVPRKFNKISKCTQHSTRTCKYFSSDHKVTIIIHVERNTLIAPSSHRVCTHNPKHLAHQATLINSYNGLSFPHFSFLHQNSLRYITTSPLCIHTLSVHLISSQHPQLTMPGQAIQVIPFLQYAGSRCVIQRSELTIFCSLT